jgi:adenosine kinase
LVIVAEHACANNKIFCLNLSAPFIVDFFGDQVATALPYADYLFCNENEAQAYGKKMGYGEDLKEVALKVAASEKKNTNRPRTVVFTHGSKSTIVAYNGTVHEYAVEPLSKDQLVDTNGAGDAFVGGFLASLLAGQELDQNVEAGHFAARFIIQQSGCQLVKPCTFNLDDGKRALLLKD